MGEHKLRSRCVFFVLENVGRSSAVYHFRSVSQYRWPPDKQHESRFIFTTTTIIIIIIRISNICSAPFTDKIRTAVHYIVSKKTEAND